MVFEQTTPDGRTLVIAWIEQYGSWRAKFEHEQGLGQGATAAEAIAAASGEPADLDWVVTLAQQVETVLELEHRAA